MGLMAMVFVLSAWAQSGDEKLAAPDARPIPVMPNAAETSDLPVVRTGTLAGPTRATKGLFPITDKDGRPRGEIRLTVEDWKGEPLMRDVFIKVEVRCHGQSAFKTVVAPTNSCAFEGLAYDAESDRVVIKHRWPHLSGGVVKCQSKVEVTRAPIRCPRS